MRGTKPVSLVVTIALALTAGAQEPSPAGTRPPARAEAISRVGPPIPPQPPGRRTVALTFDDGPSHYTPQILAVLRRNHIRATFCMLGGNAARLPALARQVAREGHQICNHSRTHANLARQSPGKVRAEVTVAQAQLRRATGVTPKTFRFPYGASDRRARTIIKGYGLRTLGWDVDPRDWQRPTARQLTARIVGHVKPGSVVLMHDGGGDRGHTAASLEATIKKLRAKGYSFDVD